MYNEYFNVYKEADSASKAKKIELEEKKEVAEILDTILDDYKDISDDVKKSFSLTQNSTKVLIRANKLYGKLIKLGFKFPDDSRKITELVNYNKGMADYLSDLNEYLVEFHAHLLEVSTELEGPYNALQAEISNVKDDEEIPRPEEDPDADLNEDSKKPSLMDRAKKFFGK